MGCCYPDDADNADEEVAVESRCVEKEYHCPVEATIDVLGGKWKLTILWHLVEGPHRFAEVGRLVGGISDRMLARQLRELEAEGLVERHDFEELPPRVEYRLTPYGRTVEPLISAICRWGSAHLARLEEPAARNGSPSPAANPARGRAEPRAGRRAPGSGRS